MERKELSVNDFLKNVNKLSETCGGCRFFDAQYHYCKEKKIAVAYGTRKCDKWRYFA